MSEAYAGWREVSQEVFYQAMEGLNVHPRIVTGWPYTSQFETPDRQIYGVTVLYFPEGKALEEKRFLLPPVRRA